MLKCFICLYLRNKTKYFIEMDIRESVKRLCKERGVTQKDIADRLEITAIGLNQILRKGNPNLQTLERIATALGVQVVDLFERPADESPTGVCPHCGKPIRIHFDK